MSWALFPCLCRSGNFYKMHSRTVQRLFPGPGAQKQFRVQSDGVIDTFNPSALKPKAGEFEFPGLPALSQTMRN